MSHVYHIKLKNLIFTYILHFIMRPGCSNRHTDTNTKTHTHTAHQFRGHSRVAPWHWSILSDLLLPLMSEVRWDGCSQQLPTKPLQRCSKLHSAHLKNNMRQIASLCLLGLFLIFDFSLFLNMSTYITHFRSCHGATLRTDQYWKCS